MMIGLSVVYGLLTMVAYGISNAYSQPLTRQYGAARFLFLRGIIMSVILLGLSVMDYAHYDQVGSIGLALLLGIAGYLPVLAFLQALKSAPLGIVAPIAGTAPVVTVLLAFFFLNMSLNGVQWGAIAAVVLANIAVSWNIRAGRNGVGENPTSSGVLLAFSAALGWGVFYALFVPVSQTLGPWLAACLIEVGVMLAAACHVWRQTGRLSIQGLSDPTLIANACLIGVGTVAFAIGVKTYHVGIVAALGNSPALVTALIGWFAFKERLRPKDIFAAAVMIAAVAVVSAYQS